MSSYEYRTVEVDKKRRFDGDPPEEKLNELGAAGFRLVERVERKGGGTKLLVFMREVDE
jgi:hypothetical protein